jgi:hypothetical protein
MSQVIPPLGSLEVTLAASDKICVATRGRAVYAEKVAGSDKVLDSANPTYNVDVNGEEYVSSAFTTGGSVLVQNMGPFNAYVEVGTAPLSKDFRRETGIQGSPVALNATGTITTAMLLGGTITSSTAALVTATLETGAVMDASTDWEVGEGFNWGVTNTGPNSFVVTAAASGHTIIVPATTGGTVATQTVALFRTVKTAADTFVTYRIA